ncbi:MAG: HEAT repeat domain-containing protein [Bdellovibrionia bacterium]
MMKAIKGRITVVCVIASYILSSCSLLPRSWTRKTRFDNEDLLSENPVHQVRAIRAVVEKHDQSQIPTLFKLMIEGEPTVRENACWATTELMGNKKQAGEMSEYHSYDSLEERKASVKSWTKYWETQQGPSNP